MGKKIPSPVIYETDYSRNKASQLDQTIKKQLNNDDQHLLTDYPTVYIINEAGKHQKARYTVYVGETNDIQQRTLQHLDTDPLLRDDWQQLKQTKNAKMYIIGHEHFNKSLTLDIENRMMHYLSGVNAVAHLNNRRDNAQGDYYKADEMIPIFNKIWRKLHSLKPDLFPLQRIVEESALFKASPFHHLTQSQVIAKKEILSVVRDALRKNKRDQLILVKGEAGAGKTVLMSNIFYDLATQNGGKLSITMMVNHLQQDKVYRQIVEKLGLGRNAKVEKVSTFIKRHDPKEPIDIAFIDEAHLLLTQRSQAYSNHGTNELLDVIKRARVVIAVYDENQILSTTQIVEDDDRKQIEKHIEAEVTLHHQMRIDASQAMVDWLHKVVDQQVIDKAPVDKKYDLRVFDDPEQMQDAITQKADEDGSNGISRMLATFDWPYSSRSKGDNSYWEVSEGSWHMPWNLQLKPSREDKHQVSSVKYSELSWAEQPHTVKEVGSTYTIQGSDLNYAGVILGPSIKYRDGKIFFDPSESQDKKAVRHRSMHDGSKKQFGEELIKNEFNVLMTRGVHGLYIHAIDPELQKHLKEAIN